MFRELDKRIAETLEFDGRASEIVPLSTEEEQGLMKAYKQQVIAAKATLRAQGGQPAQRQIEAIGR